MPKLSIQLYSAREFSPLEDQLAIIAAQGYAHVETFGALNDEPEQSAKMFAAYGLTALSAHIPVDIVVDETARAIEIAEALGARFIVAPYLPEPAVPKSAEGWRALGEKLQRASEQAAAHRLVVAWHNHAFEFRALPDGSLPIDHLLGASLNWEADIAWIARGGADPRFWLERFAGRVPIVHVKDIAPKREKLDEDGWADVGAGVLPWPDLWTRCRAAGADVFVAEHDNPSSFERFARVSAAALRALASGERQ